MLTISRRPQESVVMGEVDAVDDDLIEVVVIKIEGNKVTLGFDAPDKIKIVRRELLVDGQRTLKDPRRDKSK